ncbi:ABC-three component system middle component 6 [Nesterenkonia aurantiaca]|uniref:ABC-three component system middle component 6 n=1 Tax=Nesterenkonia aurantiaca TaxID=1436010 RepID=UPI003EE58DA3
MILPTKGIAPERSLIAVGSLVLENLDTARSPSELWHLCNVQEESSYIAYEWFCLAISLLYAMGLVDKSNGLLERSVSGETSTSE